MRLVATVVAFFLRKLGLLLAVLLVSFLALLVVSTVVPALQQAEGQRDRLAQVSQEEAGLEDDLARLEATRRAFESEQVESLTEAVEDEVEERRRSVSDAAAEAERLRAAVGRICRIVVRIDRFIPGDTPCTTAQRSARAAEQARDDLVQQLDEARADAAVLGDPSLTAEEKLERLDADTDRPDQLRELESTRGALARARAERAELKTAQGSVAGRVVGVWSQSWRWLVAVALAVILLPPLFRVVGYFLLMPLVRRLQTPLRLSAGSDTSAADLQASPAERTLRITLAEGEVLSARSEHVRPVQGTIRSQLLYDWSSPFISFASGLHSLSRITGDGVATEATLATPDDPDSYLARIDFREHPGVVVRPRHVVGVVGAPELQTRWRWGVHSLATWQVRYIMFTGTGSLIVEGCGDVRATSPGPAPMKMEQHLVMGFDSRLAASVDRTEVFWPYLRGRTPLVDDRFAGPHPFFWQKSSTEGPRNPLGRSFDAVFSALGKVLGF